MCLHHKSFENTVGKGEIAHNEQFLLFPQCFLPFGEVSAIFMPRMERWGHIVLPLYVRLCVCPSVCLSAQT